MLADTSVAEPVMLDVDPLVQLFLSISLAFIMFAVATGLKPGDFKFVRENPLSVMVGFFAQIIALPLATLALVKTLSISPALALGMIIVSCCPGGSMSNLITKIAGGDTAYSVSLTMLSSIFSAAFLPFSILFWVGMHAPSDTLIEQVNIDRAGFIVRTCLILVIPLIIGLSLASKKPNLATKLHRRSMPASLAILIILIISGLITNYGVLIAYGAVMVPLVILHNSAAFLVGALFGYTFIKDRKKSRALVFEVGIQNAGLGLIIVLAELGGYGEAVILVGMWGIWHLIGGFILANTFRFIDWRKKQLSV
ncbi:bile acid:sodium symporter family protein [Kordiimonas aquimaris]|uniref:bile acid:sodium symporter family protein n=1 Tax=Kordiimonas aquimaris TaxID=707591 RepID=UPI0021CF26E4|nr:hypothetical protein [Kordiimonas aquimaris]